jgi:hypothetical protein
MMFNMLVISPNLVLVRASSDSHLNSRSNTYQKVKTTSTCILSNHRNTLLKRCGFCLLISVNRPAGSDTKRDDHSLVLVHSEQAVDSDFSCTVKDSEEYIEV